MVPKTTLSGSSVPMVNARAFQFLNGLSFEKIIIKTTPIIFLLCSLCISTFAQVRLVADLNPGKKDPFEDKPFWQNENDGGRSFFIGESNELWTSDGTTAGTKFLKAFLEIKELEVIGDICYFSAATSEHGIELWKSNGTAAGTVRVKDIVPGKGNSTPLFLTRMNGVLYFSANNTIEGRELWRSDGTAAGTQLVKDIYPGHEGSKVADIVAESNRIFFVARTEAPGYELWVSDGSAEGTHIVKDIHPGAAGSHITDLTASDGSVFFSAQSPMRGRQLWKSDGTESGTSIVKVINTAGSAQVSNLIDVNGLIFFLATDGVHGVELFRSDGTPQGTFMLKDINQPFFSSFSSVNGKLFFITYEYEWNLDDRVVWMSDGTPGGTIPLNSNGLYISIYQNFHEINGAAYFFGKDRSLDLNGIYRFDLSGNLSLIRETYWTDDRRIDFVQMGDLHFFPADGYYWRSDGTISGTYRLRLLCCGAGSQPTALEDAGGTLYFSTANGGGFWRTQGTAETTELLENDFVEEIEGLNGDVFYRLGDSFGPGSTVWKLDGETGVKTEMSTVATDPRYITDAVDRVYFIADTPSGERKMWVSDGTPEGTHPIEASPTPNYLAALGTRIVFDANGELWVSDGTEAGTFVLANLSRLQYLRQFKGELYFYAWDAAHGLELWKTNGTPSGTVLVKDIRQNDTDNLYVHDMEGHASTNDWLYFGGINNDGKHSIWRTNGTAAGTTQLIAFESESEWLPYVIGAGSNIFIIRIMALGTEIWTIDGTEATKLKEVDQQYNFTYAAKGEVLYITTVSGPLNPDRNGTVWRSDGTVSGTYPIQFQGWPYDLETSGDYVYLAGRADKEGSELFVIEESASVSAASEVVIAEVVNTESDNLVTNFPTPFTDGFTLHVAGDERSLFKMEVLSVDGKLIQQDELACNTEHRITTTAWMEGLYLMKIRTTRGDIIRKVVKYSR
jgi:ELWxxDGT repeat protein